MYSKQERKGILVSEDTLNTVPLTRFPPPVYSREDGQRGDEYRDIRERHGQRGRHDAVSPAQRYVEALQRNIDLSKAAPYSVEIWPAQLPRVPVRRGSRSGLRCCC